MQDSIANLDDATAIRVLQTIAEAHGQRSGLTTEPTAELGRALAAEFDVAPAGGPPSEGELARQALLLLADDPATRRALDGKKGSGYFILADLSDRTMAPTIK